MERNVWLALMGIVAVGSLFGIIPAYAEVVSLQSDTSIYSFGNKIHFTGTVGIGDYKKLVNLVIHDPAGKFVLISGNYSDLTYSYQIVVDTNNTDQFYTKGTYQAIAFVDKESEGKTLYFDFSPDGSPVIHQGPSTNPTETTPNQSTSQHYQVQLKENVGINEATGNPTSAPSALIPANSSAPFDVKNILYPIISLSGAGIVIVILYNRRKSSETRQKSGTMTQSTETAPESTDDYALMILKNRLAKGEITLDEFKTIKDTLSEP